MESKGGKKKSSSSKTLFYEAPLGYSIEDIRPNGGIKKFRSAAYSNVSVLDDFACIEGISYIIEKIANLLLLFFPFAVRSQAILIFIKKAL
jgi:hypothetical protein